jgi:hypothetical protein
MYIYIISEVTVLVWEWTRQKFCDRWTEIYPFSFKSGDQLFPKKSLAHYQSVHKKWTKVWDPSSNKFSSYWAVSILPMSSLTFDLWHNDLIINRVHLLCRMYQCNKFVVNQANSSQDIEWTAYSYIKCILILDLLIWKSIGVLLYSLPTHIWNITTIRWKVLVLLSGHHVDYQPRHQLTDRCNAICWTFPTTMNSTLKGGICVLQTSLVSLLISLEPICQVCLNKGYTCTVFLKMLKFYVDMLWSGVILSRECLLLHPPLVFLSLCSP